MNSFAKYTIIDWIVLFQVVLIWFLWLTRQGNGFSA